MRTARRERIARDDFVLLDFVRFAEPGGPFRLYTTIPSPNQHLPLMASSRSGVGSFTVETLVAFLGALLVIPLLIKVVLGVVKGLFRLKIVRTLLIESILVGLTALLTKPGTLDKLFGQKGQIGDGAFKPDARR